MTPLQGLHLEGQPIESWREVSPRAAFLFFEKIAGEFPYPVINIIKNVFVPVRVIQRASIRYRKALDLRNSTKKRKGP
jgi:hypothetical protein